MPKVLSNHRRRQLVDRELPARHRVRPRQGRPDWVRTSAATSSTRTRILSSVGSGTMVADALSMMNAEFSSTSFRLSRRPSGHATSSATTSPIRRRGRTGDNCLLATKVMVPISGSVRENVGLLGSPPFEIPRSVERDSSFDHLKQGTGCAAASPPRTGTTSSPFCWCLFAAVDVFLLLIILTGIAADLYASLGAAAIALELLLIPLFGVAYWILVDRIVRGFKPSARAVLLDL